jgi:sugar lactone lactonase YvrE
MEPLPQELWTAAGPAKGDRYASQPAVDPEGRVWAASSFDHVFWIIDRDGEIVETWSGAGAGDGDGELNLVSEGNGGGDIVFRPDGGFYVADTGNARVQQFDADRRFIRSFGSFGTDKGEFVRPYDIDIDAAGNVYLYDVSRGDVQVFSEDGEFQRVAATEVGPYAAVDDGGNVYTFVNNSRAILYRYTPAGVADLAVDVTAHLPFATGLVVGPTGDLFVSGSDNGGSAPKYLSLLQLDPDGELKHVWPVGAEGVGVDPAGDRVYLTNGNDFEGAVRAYALETD